VADFQQQDKTGVTQMCKTINPTLNKLLNEVYAAEEAEDEGLLDAVQERNGILDNGGVSLFHFTANPKLFGQTVENLFYVSFLMKDGLVGIEFDSDGIPSLHKLVNFVYICRHSQLTFDSGNKC
jgi:hypothetical protein